MGLEVKAEHISMSEDTSLVDISAVLKSKSKRVCRWKPVYTKVLIYDQKGWTVERISKFTGLSVYQIARIRQTEDYKSKLTVFVNKIAARVAAKSTAVHPKVIRARYVLETSALRAARKIVSLSKSGSGNDRLQFDACRDILDRAGLKPKEVIETHEKSYSPEEISSALNTLQEAETIVQRMSNLGNPFVLGQTPALPDQNPGRADTEHTSAEYLSSTPSTDPPTGTSPDTDPLDEKPEQPD